VHGRLECGLIAIWMDIYVLSSSYVDITGEGGLFLSWIHVGEMSADEQWRLVACRGGISWWSLRYRRCWRYMTLEGWRKPGGLIWIDDF
jgi:hypothetical protein